VDNVINMI